VRGFSRVADLRDAPACADSPITRWNAFDWCELDQWKQAKSSRLAPGFRPALCFSRPSKTVRSQRGFGLGRILDLHKQELPIPYLPSGRRQTHAPLGPGSQRMSGMRSQMVRPLPVLRPDSGRSMAKPNPPLRSLQQTAETGNARGLGPPLQTFPWSSAIDQDARLAILSLLKALRESMKSTSQTRNLSLRIHDAPENARVPNHLEVYECSFDRPLSALTGVENKLAHLVNTGVRVLRNYFDR
jgi:hypothetical protein